MPNIRPKKSIRRVIGIDPGYGIVGFGLIENDKFLSCGVIRTEPNSHFPKRLTDIAKDLNSILTKYKPTLAAVEKIYFAKNARTATDVGQARGVIILTLMQHNIPIVELTPLQVKMAATGSGKADKKQVQQMIKKLLNLKTIPKPDDAADALAIALAARYD